MLKIAFKQENHDLRGIGCVPMPVPLPKKKPFFLIQFFGHGQGQGQGHGQGNGIMQDVYSRFTSAHYLKKRFIKIAS